MHTFSPDRLWVLYSAVSKMVQRRKSYSVVERAEDLLEGWPSVTRGANQLVPVFDFADGQRQRSSASATPSVRTLHWAGLRGRKASSVWLRKDRRLEAACTSQSRGTHASDAAYVPNSPVGSPCPRWSVSA